MSNQSTVASHWHQYFDDLTLSSQEFYKTIETIIKSRQFPSVTCSREFYRQSSWISEKREYLCVSKDEFSFYICAAAFGRSFFISYWLKEDEDLLVKMLNFIPFIGGWLARGLMKRSYYQIDSQLLFKDSIKSVVEDLVQKIAADKGFRLDQYPVASPQASAEKTAPTIKEEAQPWKEHMTGTFGE